jgi:methyl-accepting chemotaxis protein
MSIGSWFERQTLFVKLMLQSLALLVPLLLGTNFWISNAIQDTITRMAGNQMRELAFEAADKLDRNLFERYGDVQAYAKSAAAISMERNQIERWMETMLYTYRPIYRLMLVANKQGRVIASFGVNNDSMDSSTVWGKIDTRDLRGLDVSQDAWFREAISQDLPDGTAIIGDAAKNSIMQRIYGNNNVVMTFSAPIRNPKGEVVGVWHNFFNWQVAKNIIQEVQDRATRDGNTSTRFLIAAKNGDLLYTPTGKYTFERNIKQEQFASYIAAQAQPEGFVPARDYSNPELSLTSRGLVGFYNSKGYSSYGGTGWLVLASRSWQEVQSTGAVFVRIMLLLGIGSLLAVVLILFLAARYVSTRVSGLTQTASGLAEGNLNQVLGTTGEDEIGRLTGSFSQMVQYQRQMAEVADAIAVGDLSRTLEPKSAQDQLGIAFARMTTNLRELLAAVAQGSTAMATSSSQILSTSAKQASGVHQQSAAVAQTSATIEQVKTSSDQAVELAMTVSEGSVNAAQVALAGVEAANEANAGMAEIRTRVRQIAENIMALSEQMQQIGDIISSVNDIADQSNLLAINAAIEASRAGEQGKGFGVVAQEIRMLSEQSKEATARVKSILGDIQYATNSAVMTTEQGIQVADAGVENIARVLSVIEDLQSAVRYASQNAQLISASVRQHSAGMEQIKEAMKSIEATTQENLHIATDTRDSAQSLAELASHLRGIVEQYQVEQNQTEVKHEPIT